jgi:hypothetical protein
MGLGVQVDDSDSWTSRLPPDYFTKPASARVWNYWLRGKDHYAVDREVAERVIGSFPEIVAIARHTRQFLVRGVRELAGPLGVRQFLDIGTGLPTMQNTHEVAQSVAPDARIVYVDNEPTVLAHARALLVNTTEEGATDYIDADLRDPGRILSEAARLLDFDRPVAVMMLCILGLAADTVEQMYSIIDTLMAAMPAGSYLMIADGTDISARGVASTRQAQQMGLHYRLRSPQQLARCFRGLDMLEPGLGPVNHWRPDPADIDGDGKPIDCYGALARKP